MYRYFEVDVRLQRASFVFLPPRRLRDAIFFRCDAQPRPADGHAKHATLMPQTF